MPEEPTPPLDSAPESASEPSLEPTAATPLDTPTDPVSDAIAASKTAELGDAAEASSPPESVAVTANDATAASPPDALVDSALVPPEASPLDLPDPEPVAAAETVPAPLADAVLEYPAEDPAAELAIDDPQASDPAVEPPSETWTADSETWTDDIDSSLDVEVAPAAAAAPPSDDWEEGMDWEEPAVRSPQSSSSVSTRDALSWLQPVFRNGLALWRQLLAGIRARIPGAAKLPDRVLSGIVLGVLTLLLLLINNARQPSTIVVNPGLAESVEAPNSSDQSAALASEPDPAEQARREEIEGLLAAGNLDDDTGLIEVATSDFIHNRLTANLSDRWYTLTAADQQAIAETLLKKSRDFSFDQLELRSLDGNLLARSPVVGNSMVVLQRRRPPLERQAVSPEANLDASL